MKNASIVLAAVLLLSSCTAIRRQNALESGGSADSAAVADALSGSTPAPAEPSRSDRQIVDRFAFQPLVIKQATLAEQLDAYKNELAAEGKYDCCVKPGCNECVINSGECHCRRVVEKNGPCCGECTQGWVEGRGNVPGVDREQILEHLGCVRELYEKPIPEGETAPGAIKPKP